MIIPKSGRYINSIFNIGILLEYNIGSCDKLISGSIEVADSATARIEVGKDLEFILTSCGDIVARKIRDRNYTVIRSTVVPVIVC